MSEEQKQALKQFFDSLETLKKTGVIRSNNIFGDIGEFLCAEVYPGLSLNLGKTTPGFDAQYNGQNVQIKFSNSPDAKNIDLGKPDCYQMLIVVLGSESAHLMENDEDADYLFYQYDSAEVIKHFSVDSGYKLSKNKHFKKAAKQFSI